MNSRRFTAGIHYVSPTDFILEIDSSDGGVVLILPAISTYNTVKSRIGSLNQSLNYRFQDVSKTAATNNIIFQSNPADDINNAASVVLDTNGVNGTIIITGDNEWSLDAGSTGEAPVSADVKTVDLVATQIHPLVMADPDDFDGNTLISTPLVNATGRPMVAAFGMINQTGNNITATLWNITDDIAVSGASSQVIPNNATETAYSISASVSSANAGKQIGLKLTGVAGGTYQIMSGGIGIADYISVVIPTPSQAYPFISSITAQSGASNYITKASIGILRGLSTQTFAIDVMSTNQGTALNTTNNFSGLTLTEANADTDPTLATATTIKSNVGLVVNSLSFAPLLSAGRIVFLFSTEQYAESLN